MFKAIIEEMNCFYFILLLIFFKCSQIAYLRKSEMTFLWFKCASGLTYKGVDNYKNEGVKVTRKPLSYKNIGYISFCGCCLRIGGSLLTTFFNTVLLFYFKSMQYACSKLK